MSKQDERSTNPDVKVNKSGVSYVKASDVLKSESGRNLIKQTSEHRAAYLRRDSKTYGPR